MRHAKEWVRSRRQIPWCTPNRARQIANAIRVYEAEAIPLVRGRLKGVTDYRRGYRKGRLVIGGLVTTGSKVQ